MKWLSIRGQYFFVEWLIIEKGMTEEAYMDLSDERLEELYTEWKRVLGE